MGQGLPFTSLQQAKEPVCGIKCAYVISLIFYFHPWKNHSYMQVGGLQCDGFSLEVQYPHNYDGVAASEMGAEGQCPEVLSHAQ